MTEDDIKLLFAYDRWANNRLFRAASSLTTEQFTSDLGGAFRSVRDTLVHIVAGEWGWLKYWKEPSPTPAFLTDLWDRIDAHFHPDKFPDLHAVQQKWEEVEKQQREFVDRVTNETLRGTLPVRATKLTLAHLMQHMANHSTYHRGQVSLMMRQLGAKPPATDFAEFLLENSSSSAVRE